MAVIAPGAHRCGGESRSFAVGFVLTISPFAFLRFFFYAEPFRLLA